MDNQGDDRTGRPGGGGGVPATHRHVETHRGFAIYQRRPGFEFTPILLGKIASFVVRNGDGPLTVFAFLYSLLAPWAGEVIEEEQLLAGAVRTIEDAIDADRLGPGQDYTFEYRAGRYVEVVQPPWWIAIAR